MEFVWDRHFIVMGHVILFCEHFGNGCVPGGSRSKARNKDHPALPNTLATLYGCRSSVRQSNRRGQSDKVDSRALDRIILNHTEHTISPWLLESRPGL